MAESPHYRELLHIFNEHGVEYLIVGGYAVMKYTEPRYTKDLDVWVRNSPSNAQHVFEALARFGAPVHRDGITPETFRRKEIVYQIRNKQAMGRSLDLEDLEHLAQAPDKKRRSSSRRSRGTKR